ncbi:MAG: tetratricopeptide repeat protein [Chloroflexota bacterium]
MINMKRYFDILILLTLAVLILFPPLLVGMANLSNATSAKSEKDKTLYYESAAKFLFWRTDLLEKAGLAAVSWNPDRAINLLLTAQNYNKLSVDGQLAMGDAYIAIGKPETAISEWENIVPASAQSVIEISKRLATAYHNAGNYSQELIILRKWLEIDNENILANKYIGVLLAAEANSEALEHFSFLANNSQNKAEQFKQVISALESTDGDESYRLTKSGQALAGLNEWPLAEIAFLRAIESNPKYGMAWAWFGLARQYNNKPGALNALDYALKLDPKSAGIHSLLGTYWNKAKKGKEAQQEFATAISLEPANAAWWAAYANETAQNDLPKALNAYLQAINLEPQNSDYWYALAAFCVDNNAYIEDYGLKAALQAYALNPENPAYMDLLGRAQMASGQNSAAEAMFKKIITRYGNESNAYAYHFHIGLLYLQTGRNMEAYNEFSKTIILDPNGSYGLQAKNIIERYYP